MKLITLASAVLMLALSVVAVPQPPFNDVVVAAPGTRPLSTQSAVTYLEANPGPDMEGLTVADVQRPRHCQSCTRYIDKCIEVHDSLPNRLWRRRRCWVDR
jgi:hypothetical protein